MNDYRILSNGEHTTSDDPERGVWYASGNCGYWTDDWSKLPSRGGIPSCPGCGAPGFQTTARGWWAGVDSYDKDHPYYKAFVSESKEHCVGRGALSFLLRYKLFAENESRGEE